MAGDLSCRESSSVLLASVEGRKGLSVGLVDDRVDDECILFMISVFFASKIQFNKIPKL